MAKPVNEKYRKFYKKTIKERIHTLQNTHDSDLIRRLTRNSHLPPPLLDSLIENAITQFPIPMGILPEIIINNRIYSIPMATEEPSIVAAASKAAKIINKTGGFKTSAIEPAMVTQIQCALPENINPEKITRDIDINRNKYIDIANKLDPRLIENGGGAYDIKTRILPPETENDPDPRRTYITVDLYVKTADAMGANALNTMAETLLPLIARQYGIQPGIAIISNDASLRIANASVTIPFEVLRNDNTTYKPEQIAKRISDAYTFALRDPKRAITNNKGIMNGIVAALIPLAQDTRAVESAVHSYAAENGKIKPLATWICKNNALHGNISIPMPVAIVGGSINTHPVAKAALELINPESARQLAEILAAIGLAQNFAALLALTTEGIQKGHMKLHNKKSAYEP